jgi:RNA polymerase sigma-70 factor (ECF subfamily)
MATDINALYTRHVDTVYRVCFAYFKGCCMDAEDAVQSTFLAYLSCRRPPSEGAHEKAWLIVTAANICRNMLKRRYRRDIPLDTDIYFPTGKPDETLDIVMKMPVNERLAVYLHYYEGYTAREIGQMLGKEESTVWGYLHRGRLRLKALLEEEAP